MISFVEISIFEEDGHWDMYIRLFGVVVYHRHDLTRSLAHRQIGFTVYPAEPVAVESEYNFLDEEFKHKE